MAEVKCPECDKMLAVRDKSNAIGEFLEWLQGERKLTLCREITHKEIEEAIDAGMEDEIDYKEGDLTPDHTGIEALLAEYFDIDLKKVEEEKQAILQQVRAEHEKRTH